VVAIHGGMGREERMKAQEAFRHDPEVQVLLATDAAGEGINLQRAHLMVNYDLPWNPNRLDQRFGRKVAARLPDGRFHPRYAPFRLRARVEAEIRQSEAGRDYP
jgi:superfamily II DNA/RNA helicase